MDRPVAVVEPQTEGVLAAAGELRPCYVRLDAGDTPLGPIAAWPEALCSALRLTLRSPLPAMIVWGPEQVLLYNAATLPLLGRKHPAALGRPFRAAFPEAWALHGPALEAVLTRGEASDAHDHFVLLDRDGFVEETYFTFSWSAIRDETGAVRGALHTSFETTRRVIAERRSRLLRELTSAALLARTTDDVCRRAMETLAQHRGDVPFATIYLLDPDERVGRRVASFGIEESAPFPMVVSLQSELGPGLSFGALLAADSATPLSTGGLAATLLPIRPEGGVPVGAVVLGTSPRLRADDSSRAFHELIAEQLGTSIASARSQQDAEARAHFAQIYLQDAEERLRLALDSAQIGTWDFNPVTGALRWDDRCKAMFGVGWDAEISFELFLSAVNPADRMMVDHATARALDPRGDGTYEAEFRVIGVADGIERWVAGQGQAFFAEGRAVRFLGTVLDITERKRVESALEFLAEASATLASSFEIESTVASVSRMATPALGDWCWIDLFEDDGKLRRVAVSHSDQELVQLAERVRRYEIMPLPRERLLALDGAELIGPVNTEQPGIDSQDRAILRALQLTSAVVVPLVSRGGRLGVMSICSSSGSGRRYTLSDLVLFEEIGLRIAAALDNARLYRVSEEANRRKDEFLAMLGHELRNPLSPILTALDLMRMRDTDEFKKERTIIERQVQHLVRLVDDLLDVSRITRGKVELKRRPIDLAPVLAKAVELASPVLEQRRHELQVELQQSPPLVVEGDEPRLAQVFSNLLINAAKYTDPGGKVRLLAAVEHEWVVVRVIDTGVGIEPDLLPRVFELFVQGKRALDRSQGGLGLGLSIARSLIDQHGGRISAFSQGRGTGSEFTVRLPLAQAQPVVEVQRRGSSFLRSLSSDRRRVLIVDDNRDAAEMLGEALETCGYEVKVTFDAPSALEVAPEFRPEVALLDIGLPVMDGYELARRIRKVHGGDDIKLIAVTGYGQERDRAATREAGFVEHLVKPLDLEHLTHVVARLLGTPS